VYIFFNVNTRTNTWLRHVNSVTLCNTVPEEATRAHEQLQEIRGLHGNGYYDGVEDSDCGEGWFVRIKRFYRTQMRIPQASNTIVR